MTGNIIRALLVSLVLLTTPAPAADTVYRFSVVPQQSASKTALIWGPVLHYLEQRTGQHFRLVTTRGIPGFEQGLSEGRDDFSYMNPHHYTVFHATRGYQALVHARDRLIKGIVVVKKDSPLRALRELAGQSLAFPAPTAFAATLLVRGTFQQQGINITPTYVGSHDSVYLNVARGRFPAGGGIARTLNNMDPETRSQLRILWSSPGYTPHAIAVHPRVPETVAEAVRTALLELDTTDTGRKLLEAIKITGFMKADNSDWDDVRALHLKSLKSDGGVDRL